MKKIPALSISLAAVLLTLSALPGFRTPVGAAPPATPGTPSQPAAGKTVVLTFDDAAASHRTVVAPLLKKYGLGGTFFVCEFRGFENKEHYMSWEQIRELSEMGFEIGNHTRSHPAMSKLDREQIEEQIRYIEDKCAQYGIPHPTTFAYPGYDTSAEGIALLRERGYRYARHGGDRPYLRDISDPMMVPSYSINHKTGHTLAYVRQAVEACPEGAQ
ncbi:MAG: polysaccharide deacetylase family protein [Alistipes indistinctus]